MTFHEAKQIFIFELSSLYPENEIHSIFLLWVNHYLKINQVELAFRKQKPLPDILDEKFYIVLERLKKQEPIQYILGETIFFDLPIIVSPKVLIPRPETEELIALILNENKNRSDLNIMDIGTGSGCIAIALAKNLKSRVFAIDYKKEILDIAKKNALNNNVNITFMQFDILQKNILLHENFDIMVSNPPYVLEREKKQMSSNVLNYEPADALFVKDNNPLLYYTTIANLAKCWLNDGGKLYFEMNENMGSELVDKLKTLGFNNVVLVKDIHNKFRFVRATYEK